MYIGYIDYSKLMNELLFTVHVPEYYDPTLPEYYRKPSQKLPPIVNGIPVTMDEYIEKNPEFVPDEDFIPDIIHKYGEMDMTLSNLSIARILDLLENKVPFMIDTLDSVQKILEIIDGYLQQLKQYMTFNSKAKDITNKIIPMRCEIEKVYKETVNRINRSKPNYRPPALSLSELIKFNYPEG